MFGFFGGNKDEAQQQQHQQQQQSQVDSQQQQQQQQQTQTPANGGQQQQVDPLDQYKSWFAPKENQEPNFDEVVGKMFNLTDESLDKDLGNMNFLNITEADLAKMRAGGDEGIQATLQVLNNSLRNVMKQSARVSGSFVQHGLRNSSSMVDSRVSANLARSNAEQAVRSIEGFDNPMMEVFREPIVKALAREFPNAPPEALKSHAAGMLEAMLGKMGFQKREATQETPAAPGTDFSKWMQ